MSIDHTPNPAAIPGQTDPAFISHVVRLGEQTLGYGREARMSMNIGEPGVISVAETRQLEAIAADQFALLDSAVSLYRSVVGSEDPEHAWIRGLFEYGLVESGRNEAGESAADLIRTIMLRAVNGQLESRSRIFRLDMIGHSGKTSEQQLAMGGLGTLLALSDDPEFVGGHGQVLGAVNEMFRSMTGKDNPRVAFHVGAGLLNYGWEFVSLAKKYNEAYGEQSASVVIDDPELAGDPDLLAAYRAQGVNVILVDDRIEAALSGTDAMYRLSDSLRFNNMQSIPMLKMIADGRLKMEPPLLPFLDKSHIIQALLFHSDHYLQSFFESELGPERLARLRRQFPRSVLVEEGAVLTLGESDAQQTYDLKDLPRGKTVIRDSLDLDLAKSSGGRGVERIKSKSTTAERVDESVEAMRELRARGWTTRPIRTVAEYIETPPTGLLVFSANGDGTVHARTMDSVRYRLNPFFVRADFLQPRLFGLDEYFTQGSNWKVSGATNGGGARPYRLA